MAAKKGSKAFWNPITGEERRLMEDPGTPWQAGLSPYRKKSSGRTTKGTKIYFNPETKVHSKFFDDPGEPWIRGHSSEARKNLSDSRLSRNIRHSAETIERLRQKTTGHKFKWRENVSKSAAYRSKCDTIYLLLLKRDLEMIGKWGSTTEGSFVYREREFKRHGFTWEILLMVRIGLEAPEEEAKIGRILSKFPLDNRPDFFGKTETFRWCEETSTIVSQIVNYFNSNYALETNSPS